MSFSSTGEQAKALYNLGWETTLNFLESKLDQQIYEAYFKPLQFFSLDDKTLSLAANSNFIAKYVTENYFDLIQSTIRKSFDNSTLTFKTVVVEPSKQKGLNKVVRTKTTSVASISNPMQTGLDSKYTFDSYVIGSNNQFCAAAANQVAQNPGETYNPLFVYGGVGLGKTHLLHAIGNHILSKNKDKKVLYISSEIFTNELISALKAGKMEEFKAKLREIDCLLIDDIQFIASKERTQEEFFHTFNTLYSLKKQIVMTSDRVPNELKGVEDRLKTRFSWGLTADIQVPDFETRVAILVNKSLRDGFSLPDEVARLIAENIHSNVRELEGALTRVHAVSSLQNKNLSVELARSSLKDLLQTRRVNISIKDIISAVSVHFSLRPADLISKRRTRMIAFPRHIAMYLCRKHTTASYPEIGSEFGGRDHSSVIHAANVVSQKVKSNSETKSLIYEIERRLEV